MKPLSVSGIPEAERAICRLAHESEVVYHNMKEEFESQDYFFTDTDSALKRIPRPFSNSICEVGTANGCKLAALNSAVRSGEAIYVPKGVSRRSLQTYFRINNENRCQLERT